MYELRKQLMKEWEQYAKAYVDKLKDVEETGDFNAIDISASLMGRYSEGVSKINVLLDEFEQRTKGKKKGMW